MQAGNIDGVLTRLHPEVVVHEAESLPYGGDWLGLDGFARLLTVLTNRADLDIREYTTYPTVDGVIIAMGVRMTSRTSAQTLDTSLVEIYRVVDGLIREIDVYYKDVKALVDFLA
ncbi:nuclear transport factor 2 family protein [Mycolicibacterium sp. CH28]|uniref:nuclear transport factor 2 family protein n=1 Tax=Mycolicibacterium sp. CH28 TaxID=2512237 RepID=UPI0010809E16|nr:nuclear transport factor 2 family protein [Mycolicibacterium sp. CH28]TGD88392.1 nuclear transport factor 2 family protein [Mycolicibacterium sp. CH28]